MTTQPTDPRQLDPTQFTVTLRDKVGRPVGGATVSVDLVMPTMDMGRNTVTLTPQAPGRYVGKGRFTMPGAWNVNVAVSKNAERGSGRFPVTVR